jgi:hypothetical protein
MGLFQWGNSSQNSVAEQHGPTRMMKGAGNDFGATGLRICVRLGFARRTQSPETGLSVDPPMRRGRFPNYFFAPHSHVNCGLRTMPTVRSRRNCLNPATAFCARCRCDFLLRADPAYRAAADLRVPTPCRGCGTQSTRRIARIDSRRPSLIPRQLAASPFHLLARRVKHALDMSV